MSQPEDRSVGRGDILDQIGDLADQAATIDPAALGTTIQALITILDSGELPEGATAEDLTLLIRLAGATGVYVDAISKMNAEIAKQMAGRGGQEAQQ